MILGGGKLGDTFDSGIRGNRGIANKSFKQGREWEAIGKNHPAKEMEGWLIC